MSSVKIGSIKVTYLPDGAGTVEPLALIPASTPEGWQRHAALLDEEGKIITAIGAFLIEAVDRIIAGH